MAEQDEVDWKALGTLAFKALAGIAGLSFLFGGGLIHAVWGIDRITAEMVGIGIAVLFGFLAALLHSHVED
jgi:hypothetical protein